jgi:hypothetical protein
MEETVVRYKKTPAAAGNATVHAAVTLGTGVTTTTTTGFTNPDVPRNVTVTGNQATATGNVVVTGTNDDGLVISETIVAAGTATVAGNLAFKTVTQVVFPARGAAGDTISVGTGSKLGLAYPISVNTVLFAFLGGTKEGTAPTVALSTGGNAYKVENSTVTLNSALNGTEVQIWYFLTD